MIQESVYRDWYNSHLANSTAILKVMDQGTLSIPGDTKNSYVLSTPWGTQPISTLH